LDLIRAIQNTSFTEVNKEVVSCQSKNTPTKSQVTRNQIWGKKRGRNLE